MYEVAVRTATNPLNDAIYREARMLEQEEGFLEKTSSPYSVAFGIVV